MSKFKVGDKVVGTVRLVRASGTVCLHNSLARISWEAFELAPVPDPHADLKDAVVGVARTWVRNRQGCLLSPAGIYLKHAVEALEAAEAPKDPLVELQDAWEAVCRSSKAPDELEARMFEAINAVKAAR